MVMPTFGSLLVIIGGPLQVSCKFQATSCKRSSVKPPGTKKGPEKDPFLVSVRATSYRVEAGKLFHLPLTAYSLQLPFYLLSRRFLSAFLWCDIKRRFLLT
ncbi:hypothetical protein D3C84_1096400 [compost metagenome]